MSWIFSSFIPPMHTHTLPRDTDQGPPQCEQIVFEEDTLLPARAHAQVGHCARASRKPVVVRVVGHRGNQDGGPPGALHVSVGNEAN